MAVDTRGIGEQRAGGEEGAAGDGGAVAVGQAAVAGQGSHGRLSPVGRGAGSDSSPPVGPLQIGFLPNCYAADRRFLWLFPRGGPGYDGFTSTLGPRRNDMENTITTRLVLGRGAGRVLPLARGATLFVVRGRVRLRLPPAWPAEHLLVPEAVLDCETARVIECAGGIEVLALAGAELLVIAPARTSLWRRLAGWLGRDAAPGRAIAAGGPSGSALPPQ